MPTHIDNSRCKRTLTVDNSDGMQYGIFHKSCCRRYREILRAQRRANVIHGFLIVAITVMFGVLLLRMNGYMTLNALSIERIRNFELKALIGKIADASEENDLPESDVKENNSTERLCNQKLDLVAILNDLDGRILNQKRALDKLEHILYQNADKNFKAIALLGTSGVGKTLTAQRVHELFPWPENVHAYSWNTLVTDEVQKFQLLRNIIDQLSNCGQNLIIVDNLSTCDFTFVPIFNRLIKEREGNHELAKQQIVLVIYIFNLINEYYWEQWEVLQQLSNDTEILNYRPFCKEDLADCLRNELILENRTLSDAAFKSIIDDIDVLKTGCKQIRREVLERGEVFQQ